MIVIDIIFEGICRFYLLFLATVFSPSYGTMRKTFSEKAPLMNKAYQIANPRFKKLSSSLRIQ